MESQCMPYVVPLVPLVNGYVPEHGGEDGYKPRPLLPAQRQEVHDHVLHGVRTF